MASDARRCQHCGHPISAKRLAARPLTSACLTCAEARVPRVGATVTWDGPLPILEFHPSVASAAALNRARSRSAFDARDASLEI